MEKRKVRIYKSHDGEGKYINKTRQFLEKAQMGMQTQNESADVEEQLQSVKYYIKGLKNESVDDNQILKVLVSKGLRKDIATALILQVSQELEEEERKLEEEDEANAENQPNAEETEMGQEEEANVEEQPEEEEDEFAGYNEAIAEDDNYMNPNMEYGYGGRVGKKKFTNNVLKLLKKQEGGEEKALGQGYRFDNMNNDASTKKSSFLEKIKEISNKAAVDDLYEKMMGSNNPELIETANKMAEERNKPAEGTFEEAQSGGFIGGDNQPDMFMYGGTELPFYEADFLPEAQKGVISSKAYNTRTKKEYKDSFEGLSPYAKTVHKRGLFGRPKQWTEYYSKSTGKLIEPKDKNLKHGVEKEVWDDLSGKAKRAIRRGERQLGREARRGAKSLAEDAKFNKGVHAQYRYDSEEDLARDQKRSDDAWDKDKSFVSDIDNSDNFPYKGKVYLTHDEKGKRFDSPIIVAGPDLGYTEEDYDSKNMIDYEQKQLDEEAANEALEEKRLYEQMMKEEADAKEEMELDTERESMLLSEQKETDAKNKLKAFYDDDTDDEILSKDKLRLANQFNNLKHFRPDNSKNMELIKAKYDKGYAKEAAMEKALEDAQYKQFEPSIYDQKLGFRYGGLPKAQTGPPVKKESDPTTTTTQFGNIMSKNNSLTPNMSMNPNNLNGMPDQLNKQFLETSKKEEGLRDDDIIAIDKQRAPSNFDGEKAVNMFNAGATAVTGFLNNLDAAKQQKEMYDNNFTSDNMYASTNTKDRGDYVDYGQQLGQFRYDQMGSDTSGRFAYSQEGGYMQKGGNTKKEILKEFIDTPEFKRGLELMMQRENTDNVDPFLDAMEEADYSEEDKTKYREAIGALNDSEWLKIVPQKSAYTKTNRYRELQDLMNKVYGSERFNTPYAVGSGGPRRNDPPYYPMDERRPTPFEDGRIDPRTLEAIQPGSNEYEGMQTGGYMQEGGYAEGDEVFMTDEELEEFLANGGDVEYL